MRNEIIKKHTLRIKRRFRVRKNMHGTASKPRISVLKTNKHIHVQLIDDDNGHTLAAVSTASKEFKDTEFNKRSKEAALKLGESIGQVAIQKNIKEALFDRGSHKYHGILAELAKGARQAGLQF